MLSIIIMFSHFFRLVSGSPDISNPKLVISTKETAAVETALEISPELSFLNLAVITPTDQATVSLVNVLIVSPENLSFPAQVT